MAKAFLGRTKSLANGCCWHFFFSGKVKITLPSTGKVMNEKTFTSLPLFMACCFMYTDQNYRNVTNIITSISEIYTTMGLLSNIGKGKGNVRPTTGHEGPDGK